MPFVNVTIAKAGSAPGATVDQKARMIKGLTQVLVDVLGKDPQTVHVVIDEVDADNLGTGGESLTVRRERARQSAGKG